MSTLQFTWSELRRSAVIGALAAVIAIAAGSAAQAQAVRGTLVGNVTDSSGAAMPGVTVTITDVNTNVGRTAVTNESGNYTFSSLLSGTYRVEAELQGLADRAVGVGVVRKDVSRARGEQLRDVVRQEER